jgi:molybdenum cofactor biosynthesis enzyme MoaA
LDLKTALVTRLHIGLESVDPNKVREILRNNVKEDLTHDSEPVIDSVSRILKI